MESNFNEKEAKLRERYGDRFVLGGEYNALQAIPVPVDIYLTGGEVTMAWAEDEARKAELDAKRLVTDYHFNPATEKLEAGIVTFQVWENVLPQYKLNKFRTYLAIAPKTEIAPPVTKRRRIIKCDGKPEVYVVDKVDGKEVKRHIPDGFTFSRMGFSYDDLEILLPGEFDRIPTGERLPAMWLLIKPRGEPAIYALQGDRRRHFSAATFSKYHLGGDMAKEVDRPTVNHWPEGDRLPDLGKPYQIVRYADGPSLFVVQEGYRWHIPPGKCWHDVFADGLDETIPSSRCAETVELAELPGPDCLVT
jgi:hypothetical protein